MVQSDDIGSGKGRRSRVGPGLVAVAGVGLLAGFFALGGLTSPPPAAVAPSTTNVTSTSAPTTTVTTFAPWTVDPEDFAVADIARGEPFEWELIMAVDEGQPSTLLEHDGRSFLFATSITSDSWSATGGGLTAWRSEDGTDWTPLGRVIEQEHLISKVFTTDTGLVAIGTDGAGGSFSLWHSEDGATWDRQEIEVDGVSEAATVFPHAFGTNGEVSLVAARAVIDLEQRLADALDIPVGDFSWEANVDGDDVTFNLIGPFGLSLATLTADEVGLSQAETDLVVQSYAEDNIEILRSTDGESWQSMAIPESVWIDRLSTTPGGLLVAHGYTNTGEKLWTSTDGVDWDSQSAWRHPYVVDTWGDLLVGPSSDGRASIFVSANGLTWEDMGLSQQLPRPIQWVVNAVGAGPGGVAAHVAGLGDALGPTTRPEPVLLTDADGTEVRLDFSAGLIEVATAEGPYVWSMYSMTSEGLTVDLETGVATLTHRQSGDPLATLDLDDLREAERSYWAGNPPGRPAGFDALVFTDDGFNWSIQDLGALTTDSYIPMMDVTDTHVTAIRVSDRFFHGEPLTQGFEVWSAPIP